MDQKIFIVILRKPLTEKNEKRTDPFWEFGSFGLTGCHDYNLFNPRNFDHLNGSRLAFIQGGRAEFKLLLLTPPIACQIINGKIEAKWDSKILPFKFSAAPLLLNNNGDTSFPFIHDIIKNVNRSTPVAQFSSKFRSRSTPLEKKYADNLVSIFERIFKSAKPKNFITDYVEALPWLPPNPDKSRKRTYIQLKNECRRINKKRCSK